MALLSKPADTAGSGAVDLDIQVVSKRNGAFAAVDDLSFQVRRGSFFSILGPSGCGKTTLLRMVAGFVEPDAGDIVIKGESMHGVPPNRRPVNMVFQHLALFPMMSVGENIAYGLERRGVKAAIAKARVTDMLQRVGLPGSQDKRIDQLSGGQKQRVAIARAVVNRPKILLLDESLSALDYKLRQQMQLELKQLQRQLGITFVYVTHDQEEALSMSDRILVMHNGQAQQVGTPREIYEAPRNLFVAQFIGEINVFDGEITHALGEYQYQAMINGVEREIRCDHRFAVGDKVHVMLRPEDLRIDCRSDVAERKGFQGVVLERNYTGQTLNSHIRLENGQTVMAHEFFDEDDPDFDYSINQKVGVDWVPGWEHVIPAERVGKA